MVTILAGVFLRVRVHEHIRGNKIVCIPERGLADSPTQIEGVGLRARVLVPKPQASKQTDLRLQPPKRGSQSERQKRACNSSRKPEAGGIQSSCMSPFIFSLLYP